MTKDRQLIARYSIATITTKSIDLYNRRNEVKKKGYSDEEIYQRGIDEIEKDIVRNG